MIVFCRREVKYGNFELTAAMPPLPFPEERFDLIYAYSVFSHLAESVADRWIDELRRVLRPGGALILTTRDRFFLDDLRTYTSDPRQHTAYYLKLRKAFAALDDLTARFDEGRYLFLAVHPDEPVRDVYGEAVVPETYVRSHWSPRFQRSVHVPADRRRQQATWGFLKAPPR
jgi:SAM-dependent methyltransferase